MSCARSGHDYGHSHLYADINRSVVFAPVVFECKGRGRGRGWVRQSGEHNGEHNGGRTSMWLCRGTMAIMCIGYHR